MDNPTPESMQVHLYTVYYELKMLNEVGLRLARDDYRDKTEHDALLECFLLHVRNFVEFFEASRRRLPKGQSDDDLRGDDFLDAAKGERIRGLKVGLDLKDGNDLHKCLSHMTTLRVGNKRSWDVPLFRQKVNAAMREFLIRLTPDAFPTHKGKTKQDFERLFNTPPPFGTILVKSTATSRSDWSTD